uniref:Uncharacterized protein n=1 Tax=Panagrolaimus sp. PS1159 TaxID=55785 RepID=A0AC35ES94_9BILA
MAKNLSPDVEELFRQEELDCAERNRFRTNTEREPAKYSWEKSYEIEITPRSSIPAAEPSGLSQHDLRTSIFDISFNSGNDQ